MNDTERRFLDLSGQMEAKEKKDSEEDPIKELASDLGAIPRLGLRTIIDALADAAFTDQKLLPHEFNKELLVKKIPELLVDLFIQKLPEKSEKGEVDTEKMRQELEEGIRQLGGQVTGETAVDNLLDQYVPDEKRRLRLKKLIRNRGMSAPEIKEMIEPILAEHATSPQGLHEEIREFLEDYSNDNGKSLFQFIRALEQSYPNVDFKKILQEDEDLQQELIYQIWSAARAITLQKYASLYRSNPRNFILDYLFKRVLYVEEDGDFLVRKECLEPLIKYLDEQNFPLEDLYTLVYEELIKLSALRDSIAGTRASIRNAAMVLRQTPLLDKGLDFDKIWKENFEPVIKRIREKDLRKGRVRMVDVTVLNPRKMSEVVKPEVAREPFREKVEAVGTSEEAEIREYRRYLNYIENGREGSKDIETEKGSNIAYLDDRKLLKTLSKQLRKVQKFLAYMMEAGFRMRPDRKHLEEECSIPEPLLHCERVLDLWKWVGHPEKFKEEYPEYAHLSDDVIAHFAGKIHELLLVYRKFSFRDEFKQSKKNRKTLEKYMQHHLNMRDQEQVNMKFRVREWVKGSNGEPELVQNNNTQKLVKFQEAVTDTEKLLSLPGEPDEECIVFDNELRCWFRYYPMEEKKFEKVTMDVANGKEQPVVTRQYYIYSGDGNLIHRKKLNSYLSSCIRGKKSSDILRWTVVSDNEEDCDAFKNWLYDNYSTGNFEVIRDIDEQRVIVEKEQAEGTRGKGSRDFVTNQRNYHGSLYATLAMKKKRKKGKKEKVKHKHLGFETQIMSMNAMLLSASDYTPSSHTRVYTPEREFNSIFKFMFPPALFGQKVARTYLQGYRGDRKLAA